MRRLRRIAGGLTAIIGIPLVLVGALLLFAQTGPGRDALAGLVSDLASGEGRVVTIGGIEGAVPSDMTLTEVSVSDEEGRWLFLDTARLAWSPLRLATGVVSIEAVEVSRIEFDRLPVPADTAPAEEGGGGLPALEVRLDRLAVDELVLGQPLLGEAATVSISGSARLAAPAEGMSVQLDVRRVDGIAGEVSADLAYLPESGDIDLDVVVDEPAGGIVSRLSDIPGLPPLRLAVDGQGTLDDFAAQLDLAAGDQARASGTARISGDETARSLGLDITGELAGLLQPELAPLVEGTTTLSAAALMDEAGVVTVRTLELLSAAAWLSVTGTADTAARTMDLNFETVAGEADRFREVLPVVASWSGLEFTGSLQGEWDRPALEVELVSEGLSVDGNSIGALQADLSATAQDPLGAADAAMEVTLSATASDVDAADAAIADLVNGDAGLELSGTAYTSGRLDAERLAARLPAGELTWQGTIDTASADGSLSVPRFDLAALSGLANRELAGAIRLDGDVAASFDGRRIEATIDTATENLATGTAAVDGLLGEEVTLSGGISRNEDGSFALDGIELSGAAITATADGSATEDSADVTSEITLRDLSRLDSRLTGSADVTAQLSGSLNDLAVTARAATEDATAMGRPLEGLVAEVEASDVTTAPRGSLRLSGSVDEKPLDGGGTFVVTEDRQILVDDLDVAVGSVRLAGDVHASNATAIEGELTLRADDLSDVSALLLTELAGQLSADVTLSHDDGQQSASFEATARDLRYADFSLGALNASGRAGDIFDEFRLDAQVEASAVNANGTQFEMVRLEADGGLEASDVRLEARGFDAELAAAAQVSGAGGTITVDLQEARLARDGVTATLAEPATLRVVDGAVETDGLALTTGGGSLRAAGRAGAELDLTVNLQALPLSLAEVAAPGLGLSGTVSGEAQVTGSPAELAGSYNLTTSGFSMPALRDAGLRALAISAQGGIDDGRVRLDARVEGEGGIGLDIAGSVPMAPTDELDLSANGTVQLAVFSALLAATGETISGPVAVDLALSGLVGSPNISGTAQLSGGSFSSPLNGIELRDISFQARGDRDQLTISSLSATTPNGGRITGSGNVRIAPDAGFPVNIDISANNAQVLSSDLVTAVADADVQITGPAATRPVASGRVTLRRMEIQLPERMGGTAKPIQVEHRNVTPQVARQLAREAEGETRASRGGGAQEETAFTTGLDLTVSAPNQIFVRGQGINAELGGEIEVQGTTADPIVLGDFEVLRGQVTMLTQRIEITRGRLTFPGTLQPELDFVAETSAQNITAQINITGTAAEPEIGFSSSPELPEDEVLARLLFNKATEELSAGEAVQLAAAAAELTGAAGGGTGLVENLRSKLGVDVLDITAGADGPAVGVGRYINDNIYLGVRQGASAESSRVTVDIDITDRIKARGEVGADGSSSVGVNMEWDY